MVTMVSFDFITQDDLRNELESDYREMQAALESKAFKAVHVLSGSIIEAILADHLLTIDYEKKSGKDPLTMTLDKLIEACKAEKVISVRVAELSTVVRSYRNLIHPARVVRLNEKVDANGAKVAHALTEMIVSELSEQRKTSYGYTAKQILEKIEKDSSTPVIFDDILKRINRHEQEKLLILIPLKYANEYQRQQHPLISENEQYEIYVHCTTLANCFHLVFDVVADEIKKKIATRFAQIIRDGSEPEIRMYAKVFFESNHIKYLSPEDEKIVHKYIVHRIADLYHEETTLIKGIGYILTKQEAVKFTDATVKTINTEHEKRATLAFETEFSHFDIETQSIVSHLTHQRIA